MSEDTKGCLWFYTFLALLFGMFACFLHYKMNKNDMARMEKERSQITDSMRTVRIRDSIRHTPAYLDSVKQVEEQREIRRAEIERREQYDYHNKIMGFWHVGDSIYHKHFSCYFYKEDIGSLRFITQEMADNKGLIECEACSAEWVEEDMIPEYITEYYTTSEIIKMYDITSSDLE